MSARAVACALGADLLTEAERHVASFSGLPHRLRLISDEGGVLAFDDSKSTTPDAALLAIEAVAGSISRGKRGVHLIAGGYDKGANLTRVALAGAELGGLYTIGATGAALAEASGDPGRCFETLERAVRAAVGRAAPGDAVLLSPGCASWDQFDNFEQRGRRFADLVRECLRTRKQTA